MSERVLVIGAHCDDESFGCLGTLLKHKEAGDEFAFLWFSHARDTMQGSFEVGKHFDAIVEYVGLNDQQFDTYPLIQIMAPIEEMVERYRPTIVYCPFIADLNKDHRIVAEATMVACRPYKPHSPREVWMYEIRGTTELGFREFRKDLEVNIDAFKKLELLRLWYPNELINGREGIPISECFEKWPRI
jgi:LmbE family N-acetylglucosaminyl deacetylase